MTDKLQTLRIWSAVAAADRKIACQARRALVSSSSLCQQARAVDGRAAKLARRATASWQLGREAETCAAAGGIMPSTAANCFTPPSLPAQGHMASSLPPSSPPQPPQQDLPVLQQATEQPLEQQDQLWQRFVLSRKTVVIGAGLGAGAALLLWSGGLLAAPALHLAGVGAVGAKAGTVAAAASLTPTLAAGGVCAAACQGAGTAAVVPLLSNAVLSAAAGGSMLGGAGAASVALLCHGRDLLEEGPAEELVEWQAQQAGAGEPGEAG